MRYDAQWIRLAGNSRAIKDGSRMAWRCFLEDGALIALSSFSQIGESSAKNCLYRTVHDHPEIANGLSAWIDMYGELEVDGEAACLTLKDPA